ncbi:MAG: hypothetical protein AAGE76_07425 [Pseudomonadota bacterium]
MRLRFGARHGVRVARICVALAVFLAGPPGFADDTPPEAALPAYERCLAEAKDTACAGVLAAFCLDTVTTLDALTACRGGLAAAVEGRVAELVQELGGDDPALRRAALERVRGAERSVGANCAAYAARVPQADNEHHAARCALLAAHGKMAELFRLRALAEPET